VSVLLVGETIDRRRAHAKAVAGELIQLVRGVYAQTSGDIDAAVLAHAVRIAHMRKRSASFTLPRAATAMQRVQRAERYRLSRQDRACRASCLQGHRRNKPSLATAVMDCGLGPSGRPAMTKNRFARHGRTPHCRRQASNVVLKLSRYAKAT
jgi:serine/threonine-protein kinase HipA